VAKSEVTITRGHTARLKTLEIEGASVSALAAFVARYQQD